MNEKELRLELTAMQKELDEANEKIEKLENAMNDVFNHIDAALGEFEEVYKILTIQQDRIRHLYICKKDD